MRYFEVVYTGKDGVERKEITQGETLFQAGSEAIDIFFACWWWDSTKPLKIRLLTAEREFRVMPEKISEWKAKQPPIPRLH